LSEVQIAQLPFWVGRRQATLGDFFDVHGEYASIIRVEGASAALNGLGASMSAGELLVDGDAGDAVGAGMTGGRIDVRGRVGDDAGRGMYGGVLCVHGDAGARLGAAAPGASQGMSGGEIVVRGSAGDDVGARCRRGLIAVCGDVGGAAGRSMIAGSVLVVGRVGPGAGQFNKRGSLIAIGGVDVPATYRYACTYRPPHVRLTLAHIARRYDVHLDPAVANGRFRRYCGDLLEPGKGEILQWLKD
jgi:formylmethanofuran dehydrogenase subunit C